MSAASTIYALATAPGKSGVAVVRVSGPHACAVLQELGIARQPAPRVATLATLSHRGQRIDQALVLCFPAPNSFTGEPVVELHTHGGRAVIRALLDALGACEGLRLAEPGEFARRAFLNGKLDLAQAEALADLIDAETASQHRQALRQLGGDLTERSEALRNAIIEPLALLEAYIDFPDEEIPDSVLDSADAAILKLNADIAGLLDDRGIGEKIREGIDIVLIGAPNAGKSSLLNALARREAAIVSPEAGTTRDLIEVPMELAGYAVTLVDTAGLREASSGVEAEGIRRARERAERADLKLHLVDAITRADSTSYNKAQNEENTLLVFTKIDLAATPSLPPGALAISARTGDGMNALIERLKTEVGKRMESARSPLITRARHRESLTAARDALTRFDRHLPLELRCEELRHAANSIGKITGKIAVDEVLDLVFRRFCIGK